MQRISSVKNLFNRKGNKSDTKIEPEEMIPRTNPLETYVMSESAEKIILNVLNRNNYLQYVSTGENSTPTETEILKKMEREEYAEHDIIIREGDIGDRFFVIEEGTLRVTQQGDEIRIMGPGDLIGDLALTYNAPRTATVTCLSKTIVWSLKSDYVKAIQHNNSPTDIERRRAEWLINVPEFAILSPSDQAKLVSCLKVRVFETGEYIYKEGQVYNECYLFEKGQAAVFTTQNQITDQFEVDRSFFICRNTPLGSSPSKKTIASASQSQSINNTSPNSSPSKLAMLTNQIGHSFGTPTKRNQIANSPDNNDGGHNSSNNNNNNNTNTILVSTSEKHQIYYKAHMKLSQINDLIKVIIQSNQRRNTESSKAVSTYDMSRKTNNSQELFSPNYNNNQNTPSSPFHNNNTNTSLSITTATTTTGGTISNTNNNNNNSSIPSPSKNSSNSSNTFSNKLSNHIGSPGNNNNTI